MLVLPFPGCQNDLPPHSSGPVWKGKLWDAVQFSFMRSFVLLAEEFTKAQKLMWFHILKCHSIIDVYGQEKQAAFTAL